MNVVLSAADLVVSRAGAGAIAEITRCRIPSILIPYPYAADNHQYLNASFLEEKGGGIVCMEEEIEKNLLKVKEVIFNEEFRAILRRNLFSMDGGDIGAQMTSDLIQCIQEHSLAENFQSGGVLRLFA